MTARGECRKSSDETIAISTTPSLARREDQPGVLAYLKAGGFPAPATMNMADQSSSPLIGASPAERDSHWKARFSRPQFSLRFLLCLPVIVAICFVAAHYLERRRHEGAQRQMLLDALERRSIPAPTRDLLSSILRNAPSLDDPILKQLGLTSYWAIHDGDGEVRVMLTGIPALVWDSDEVRIHGKRRRVVVFEHDMGVTICLLDASNRALAVAGQFGPFCRADLRNDHVLEVECQRVGVHGPYDSPVIADSYVISESGILRASSSAGRLAESATAEP